MTKGQRHFLEALGVVTIALGTGCSEDIPILPAANEPDLAMSLMECPTRLDVFAELGVPGQVFGHDCYAPDRHLVYSYRYSPNPTIIQYSFATWISTPDEPLYAIYTDSWYMVTPNLPDKGIVKDSEYKFEQIPFRPFEVTDSSYQALDALLCTQFASALIHNFVFDGVDFPADLSTEALNILNKSYDDPRERFNIRVPDRSDPRFRTDLGNRSLAINLFCANGGTLFQ